MIQLAVSLAGVLRDMPSSTGKPLCAGHGSLLQGGPAHLYIYQPGEEARSALAWLPLPTHVY